MTEADRAVERALRERLAAERPDDGVLGEELGEAGSGERRWVLDPLDGTEWFARGIPLWGTLIALEDARGPLVAVVSAPALRRRWWALRGGGAFRDGRRLAVSRVAAVADAFVAHANLYLGFEVDAAPLLRAARLSGGWESFLALMLVAEGAVDAAFAPRGFLWDLLPAQLIVEEAGGTFTDFGGAADRRRARRDRRQPGPPPRGAGPASGRRAEQRLSAHRSATRQTQAISSACTGSRAHSSGRGTARKRPALTAMLTLAGKIATSVAISHQPAARRVRAGRTPAPPAISAAPLA